MYELVIQHLNYNCNYNCDYCNSKTSLYTRMTNVGEKDMNMTVKHMMIVIRSSSVGEAHIIG